METLHIPVLQKEVLSYLHPAPNQNFVDATFGAGGHSRDILQKIAPNGKLFVFDLDPSAIKCAYNFGSRVYPIRENFFLIEKRVRDVASTLPIHGILFDLGISSEQLADSQLGLSFQVEAPLDMRLARTGAMTAKKIINTWSSSALVELLRKYGEERQAKRIVSAIINSRKMKPIQTTTELAQIVVETIGGLHRRIHPATKTFQALRIAVNNELEHLKQGLNGAMNLLAPQGRLAVISFHSLEDRIVKQAFRLVSKKCICPEESLRCTCERKQKFKIITKKPIRPSWEEVSVNARARSAKLRVLEKLV